VSAALRLAPLLVLYVLLCALLQPGGDPVRDEPAFLAAAERLVADGRLADTAPDADQRAFLWHGPGLIVVLAPFVALHVALPALRFLEPLLLGAAMVVFRRLLGIRLAPRAALAWTYVLGLYAPLLLVLGTLQKEPLAILLVVAAMLALTRGLEGGRPWPLLAAGLALGALTMVRLEFGWVVLVLSVCAALWCARQRHRAVARRSLVVAAIAAITCLPWLAYTRATTGRTLYWGSSSGLSLFWMSPTLPGETGQWHSPVLVFRDPALAPYRPWFRHLDAVPPLLSDIELRHRAMANIRARPLAYGRNLAANASRLLFFEPVRPPPSPAALAMYAVFNGALTLGVVRAARVLWRRRAVVPPETAPIALFTALAIAVHLPPSASPRMLLPIVPPLVWLVALSRAGIAHKTARQ
jgi:4-amino-4-deoxy-L-arabinose transferase-like glycosyltransferase